MKKVNWVWITLLMLSVTACSENQTNAEVNKAVTSQLVALDVFKNPSCDCCGRWMSHVDSLGFKATHHHPTDLNAVKTELGIAPEYQSCHTGVSKDGYVFEGHIPAKVMQRFLAEKPKSALGLAVPGMPMGSPGMEMGSHYDDYDVLLLKKDGSAEVYEQIRFKG